MVAIWRAAGAAKQARPIKKVLRTEHCRDADGQGHRVVVWGDWPGLPTTSYTLDDGTPVLYEDDDHFSVATTGMVLTRCED